MRLLDFAVSVITLVNALRKTVVGRHIKEELLRLGTSAGSNYEGSPETDSRANFIHKMGTIFKLKINQSVVLIF